MIEELSNDLTAVQSSDLQLQNTESNNIQQNAQRSKKLNEKIYPVFVKIPKKSSSSRLSANHAGFYLIIFAVSLIFSLIACCDEF